MAYENRPPHNGPDNSNNGLSGGQIALIILACLLIVGVIAALIAWLMQDKRKNKSSSKQNIVQIGGPFPQNNIQQPQNAQSQQTPDTNQPAAPVMQNNVAQPVAPVMQNNVVQPVAQNNPALADTAINQQDLIANVVAAATPQIMASMAQFAAQEADMEKKKEETEKKKEEITNNKSDDNDLQPPKTEEKKSENIDDEEEKGQQKLEQSDLENLGLKAFAGRLTNPFEQLPMEKEIDNINYSKEQREHEQAQQKNDGNNIAAETPEFDFASLLGLPTKQNEQKKMDNMTGSQEMPQTVNFGNISGSGSPEMKAGGGIDMLNRDANVFTPDMSMPTMNNNQGLPIMTQNKSTEPISQKEDNNMMPPLFNFMPPAQNDNQAINKNKEPMQNNFRIVGGTPETPSIVFDQNKFNESNEKYAKMFDQLISPSQKTQQPVSTTRMPLPITQPKQKDDIALNDDEPITLFNNNKFANDNPETPMPNNMMASNMMPEPNTQGNNLPNNMMPPVMAGPIKENNVNYNSSLNANMIPPMDARENTDAVPNEPVTLNNSIFNQPQPINEDDIKPDAPIFTPPMMQMTNNNEPKMQEEIRSPSILQAPKEEPDIKELPIPMQVNAQNKEQDKNSKEGGENIALNQLLSTPKIPMKKNDDNPIFNVLPCIDGANKQMEANNEKSKMNLDTNKCMCPDCTG